MRVILDTNCLVVCLPVTSPFHCLWQAFRNNRITLCFTTDMLEEYEEILQRFYPQSFVDDVIHELLLAHNCIKANNYFKWNLITTDPDDNKFVDCALNAGAEYIVTNDKHFNVLKDIDFPPIKVIDIVAFREMLKQ